MPAIIPCGDQVVFSLARFIQSWEAFGVHVPPDSIMFWFDKSKPLTLRAGAAVHAYDQPVRRRGGLSGSADLSIYSERLSRESLEKRLQAVKLLRFLKPQIVVELVVKFANLRTAGTLS